MVHPGADQFCMLVKIMKLSTLGACFLCIN